MTADKPSLFHRAKGRARRAVPTRESMEGNRWLRPVAHRVLAPPLWRFTRRSVPRGVALGLLAGVLVPLAQIPLAAVLAFPLRANIPAAALTTFVTNPITMAPLYWLAYKVGTWILQLDARVPGAPIAANVNDSPGWIHWLFAQAGPATIIGLVTIAVVSSVLGYVVSSVLWRLWIARKWKKRRRKAV
ncbi:hypothetical protein FHR23_001754 [Stakelama sediminis]|uniref:DUF2062 domain-containing protein n=1 Tax=Stakelama sediminis TaxID=463200 RepID=A0A840YYH6_9SPHN|nr:hypothetical protein [Stakelama sediminis]